MSLSTENRALSSLGTSNDLIYQMVVSEVKQRNVGGRLYDVGCGAGLLRSFVSELPSVTNYVGVDIVRYDGYPSGAEFVPAPLDQTPWPIDDAVSDITCCVETIEHLENPRSLYRELVRITRPGGIVIVTTPNQASLLSCLTLVAKGQFTCFQERPGLYPAHITALLPIDLQRIATECGLQSVRLRYSDRGRIPGMAREWPAAMRFKGAWFSDGVLCAGVR